MTHERQTALELITRTSEEGKLELCAPDVGVFTDALPRGSALAPGQAAGSLLRLGLCTQLVVPEGAFGSVASERHELVHRPVECGEVLYELESIEAGANATSTAATDDRADAALVLRATQSGRFYHRPSPDAAPFVATGSEVEEGTAIGMLEIMKTFSHVTYRTRGGLPARARVVRLLVDDAADVSEGTPLLEVEAL